MAFSWLHSSWCDTAPALKAVCKLTGQAAGVCWLLTCNANNNIPHTQYPSLSHLEEVGCPPASRDAARVVGQVCTRVTVAAANLASDNSSIYAKHQRQHRQSQCQSPKQQWQRAAATVWESHRCHACRRRCWCCAGWSDQAACSRHQSCHSLTACCWPQGWTGTTLSQDSGSKSIFSDQVCANKFLLVVCGCLCPRQKCL